jgi:cGMP-dependent protein kinase
LIQKFCNFKINFRNELVLSFFQTEIPENNNLFYIDETANLFYIIEDGLIELENQNGKIMVLNNGGCFGIEALKENKLRIENAKVKSFTSLLCISGEIYRNLIELQKLKVLNEKINFLKSIPIFKYLDQIQLVKLANVTNQKEYKDQDAIIYEGQNYDRIYMIREGIIKRYIKHKQYIEIYKGEFFGEINLFIKRPSVWSYVTNSKCSIFELTFRSIRDILGTNYKNDSIYRIFLNCIQKSEKAVEFLYSDVAELFNIFQLKYYGPEDVVFSKKSHKNKKICIVIFGSLMESASKEVIVRSEDIFGETIIDLKTNLTESILSKEVSLTFEADWENILKSLKLGSTVDRDNFYDRITLMNRIPIFSSLSESKLFQIAHRMIIEEYQPNVLIVQEGTYSDKFYIIKTGKVKMTKKKKLIRELEVGSCFGEDSVLTGLVKNSTITTTEFTQLFVLSKASMSDITDQALMKHLERLYALQDVDVNIENLYFLKTLGQGRYGKVLLVHNKKNLYAIKYGVIKEICSKSNLIKYFLNEKNLMMMTDNPFIIKLVKTLRNKHFLFFLLEFIDGITLKTYLDKKNQLSDNSYQEVRFYGGCLYIAIHYLHKKGIIHRDIKPENCMIDRNGYLKLIDFGVAKHLNHNEQSKTLCGTPYYVAPEVILGKGYSFSADYWSIAVTLFEILYGRVPFGHKCKNVLEIYQEILKK